MTELRQNLRYDHSLGRGSADVYHEQLQYIYILFCDRPNGRSLPTLQSLSYFASNYKGQFSMDCKEQGSHARGEYPTQDTSRMGAARAK